MEKTKSKKIIKRILFGILIILALMIIKGTTVQAAPETYLLGGLDIYGKHGIPRDPHPYVYGEYYCIRHRQQLVRKLNDKSIVYLNRVNRQYSNEEILYEKQNAPETEQSIAAAEYVYQLGGGSQKDLQKVIWSSGQWASETGYVKNLIEWRDDHASGSSGSKLISRAEDWANFYYRLLQKSGNNKLNVTTTPTDEKDLRVMVNQPDRRFIQGPYTANIVTSSGSIMNNNATQYSQSPNLGTLVYNEIMDKNVGEDLLKFCQVDTAVATITYVDGSKSTQSISTASTEGTVTLLDESGNTILFPEFGKKFYINVQIPTSETRAVADIQVDFTLKFITKIKGTSTQYKAGLVTYELENEILSAWSDSKLVVATSLRNALWETNKYIKEVLDTNGEMINNAIDLRNYLIQKVLDNAEKNGLKISGYVSTSEVMQFQAEIIAQTATGNTKVYRTNAETNHNLLNEMKEDIIKGYQGLVKTEEYTSQNNGNNYWRYTIKDRNEVTGKDSVTGSHFHSKSEADEAGKEKAIELGEKLYNKVIENTQWNFRWYQNPTLVENVRENDDIQENVIIELNASASLMLRTVIQLERRTITKIPPNPTLDQDTSSFHLIGTDCTVELGGKVWEDIGANKDNSLNGKLGKEDRRYGGMLVELYKTSFANRTDSPNSAAGRLSELVATTTTNADGSYHFDRLNALEKYIVVFTFNGQMYQQTYYKDDLQGGYSNAKEIARDALNDRFDRIDSSPNNYNYSKWKQAYGEKVKLRDASGNYISNGQDSEGNPLALTYTDAWNQFVAYAQSSKSYNSAYNSLANWLNGRGVGQTDRDGVIQYIKDCMIRANTRTYPVYDYFVIEDINNPDNQPDTERHVGRDWNSLYIKKSNQSINVDFGINKRDTADLALQKDVYKTMVRVNGKTQTYMYNKKDANILEDGTWNIPIRRADMLYNGDYRYNREIRKSEYLYDGTISGNTSVKDLQVFVTYRIVVRNQSQTYDSVVNEIVDYYDSNEYTFDGNLNGNVYTPHTYKDYDDKGNVTNSYINSYVGDRKGNKIGDLTITKGSTLGNGVADTSLGNGYTPIYLSGITKQDGNNRLSTGDLAYVYLTFKVNQHTDENGMNGRVQMDVDTKTGEAKGVGKRNLAEINGYSTYYKQGITVPNTLGSGDKRNDRDVSGQKGGSLDLDSSAGNLNAQDLKENGDIIITDNPVTNRAEDDSDKAPNIRLVFPENDNQERVITGYVYEDERETQSDKAVVGNGVYDEGKDTKINGVTVQLVELVQNVDSDGIPLGSYAGEYVWNAKTWNGSAWVDTNSSATSGSTRYYSGQKEVVSPIISGPGATAVKGYEITEEGRYAFKSLPTGDLFIRFIYGDTTQTTLTKIDGEGKDVANLLSSTPADNNGGYISNSGLNAKSYNGQDYKSTTYQTGVNQSAGTFNGINGYLNIEGQNYNITTPNRTTSDYVNRTSELITADGTNKGIMYYYNIGESQVYGGVSDAKDVANIRENVNEYSRGIRGLDGLANQTLINGRAEVLASGLKVGSSQNANDQVTMIKEFMNNTAMVAQTGVINTEVEYNTKQTNNQGDKNVIGYVIEDVDLGLEERPVSQLKVNKEVTNLKITLANGQVMFDTNKQVTNVTFAEHMGHLEYYNAFGGAFRLARYVIGNNSKEMPELITTYMDEELMYGARIEATYTFTVTNIGEVDYLDKQFYYTGKTSNADVSNISTTGADQIIDYVSNNLQFLPTNSSNGDWSIRTVQELTEHADHNGVFGNNKDLVNVKWANTLRTYNNIVTAKGKGINTALKPITYYAGDTAAQEANGSASTQMVLSSTLVPDTGDDSMVYNNLTEIVQTSNTQGRRMKYSISGNQEMSNQNLKPDSPELTKADLVTPAEIDADSSQKILILPPTGANKNYTLWIVVGTVIAVLIGGSVLLIKKFLNKK